MKHIIKQVKIPVCGDLISLTGSDRPLFLDIETTGLSSERNHIYLIGCCFPTASIIQDGLWEFHQWFSECPADEPEILREFSAFFDSFEQTVHFNGDTFDLPFLHARAQRYQISEKFLDHIGLDLLKQCRRMKRLLALPNVKQKTLEAFLGLDREDLYSGGQLIEIYRAYVKHPDPDSEHLLLLHNEEDILGMPALLPILTYQQFLNGQFCVEDLIESEVTDSLIRVTLQLDLSVPQPVFFREEPWTGLIRGDRFHLTIPRRHGELKMFFPNYRDYYYLPAEDTAMHKSVAEFVDREYRVKATRETAYIRHTGSFLPIPGCMEEQLPVFHDVWRGNMYIEHTTDSIHSPDFWNRYVHLLTPRLR